VRVAVGHASLWTSLGLLQPGICGDAGGVDKVVGEVGIEDCEEVGAGGRGVRGAGSLRALYGGQGESLLL